MVIQSQFSNHPQTMTVQAPRNAQNAFISSLKPLITHIFLAAHQALITSDTTLRWSFDRNAKSDINPADPKLEKEHLDPAAASLSNLAVPKDFSRTWNVHIEVIVDGAVIFSRDVRCAHNTNALELALGNLPGVRTQSMSDGTQWITGIAGIVENATDGWQFRTPEGLPYVLAERQINEREPRILLSVKNNPVLLGWDTARSVERAIAFAEKRKSIARPWSKQNAVEPAVAMVAESKARRVMAAAQLKKAQTASL